MHLKITCIFFYVVTNLRYVLITTSPYGECLSFFTPLTVQNNDNAMKFQTFDTELAICQRFFQSEIKYQN